MLWTRENRNFPFIILIIQSWDIRFMYIQSCALPSLLVYDRDTRHQLAGPNAWEEKCTNGSAIDMPPNVWSSICGLPLTTIGANPKTSWNAARLPFWRSQWRKIVLHWWYLHTFPSAIKRKGPIHPDFQLERWPTECACSDARAHRIKWRSLSYFTYILDPGLRSRNFSKYGFMYWNSSFNVPNTFTLAKFSALYAVALLICICKVSAALETTILPCGSAPFICKCATAYFSGLVITEFSHVIQLVASVI